MHKLFRKFRDDEDGAVSVDWVVLTGGLLILGVVVAATISDGTTDMSTGMGAQLSAAAVPEITWN